MGLEFCSRAQPVVGIGADGETEEGWMRDRGEPLNIGDQGVIRLSTGNARSFASLSPSTDATYDCSASDIYVLPDGGGTVRRGDRRYMMCTPLFCDMAERVHPTDSEPERLEARRVERLRRKAQKEVPEATIHKSRTLNNADVVENHSPSIPPNLDVGNTVTIKVADENGALHQARSTDSEDTKSNTVL